MNSRIQIPRFCRASAQQSCPECSAITDCTTDYYWKTIWLSKFVVRAKNFEGLLRKESTHPGNRYRLNDQQSVPGLADPLILTVAPCRDRYVAEAQLAVRWPAVRRCLPFLLGSLHSNCQERETIVAAEQSGAGSFEWGQTSTQVGPGRD